MSRPSGYAWFNEVPTPSLILDCKGGLVAFNRAARTTLGPLLEQWKSHGDPVSDRANNIHGVFPVPEGKGAFSHRMGLCQPDGNILWLDLEVSPLPEGGFMVLFEDASKEVLARAAGPAMLESRQQAQSCGQQMESQLRQCQKLENLGILAGGVAHDMNNVLGAILGLASSLREDQPEGSTLAKPLEVITHACDRGRTLVRGLLDFSRKELTRTQQVDLNALVQEQIHLLERTTLQRLQLATRLDPELRPIQGDPAEISHVLMNLCVNALDAMSGAGTITIRTWNAGRKVILSVEDTGCGIPQDILKKVMDPFFTTKEPGKGTGLGLSMAHGTMKAHHGEIQIQSTPGSGATVTLTFPAGPVGAISEPSKAMAKDAAFGAVQVLAADDDELVRYSLSVSFKTLGLKSVIVQSGEEALNALKEGLQPELVLLNVNMPGLGGKNTLTRLRISHPHLPVLLTTGHVDQEVVDFAKAQSEVEILAKPFTVNELRDRIEAMLSLNAARGNS